MRRRLDRKEKKRRKKLFVFLCALVICVFSVGYATFSTNFIVSGKGTIVGPQPDSCFTVSDNGDGTGTITNYDETCGLDVWISEKINNLTITKIGDAKWNGSTYVGSFSTMNISSVKLPSTLKYIGVAAFYHNTLENLIIPDGVEMVSSQAFRYNYISELVLPNTINSIGQWAFFANELEVVEIPSSVTYLGGGSFTMNNVLNEEDRYIYGRNSDGSINYSILSSYAFKTIDEVKIADSVTTFDTSCFEQVTFLNTTLSLPSGITKIGSEAFNGTNIEVINIDKNVETIVTTAFRFSKINTINMNKSENSISGAPWGATNATVNWLG